jgi:predicted homoserine dehydrogenase-like protein
MNLYAKLQERETNGKRLRVGLIGAGKFGAMYLAQVPKTPGLHLAGIADLSPQNARTNLERVGWKAERYAASSLDAAISSGLTHVGEDRRSLRTLRWTSSSKPPAIRLPPSSTHLPHSDRASTW